MAFVDKLANLIKRRGDHDCLNDLAPQQLQDKQWLTFVEKDLAASNENNNRQLGEGNNVNDEDDNEDE